MRSRYTIPGLAVLLLAWAACTLNPQPLPPAATGDRGNDGEESSGGALPAVPGADAGNSGDAGVFPTGDSGSDSDAAATDAGDSGILDAGPNDAGSD